MITPDRPTPAPSSSGPLFPDLTALSLPLGLDGDFEAPHLIVTIDKANPSKIIGNGYNAQLSPTVSTLVVYDLKPSYVGRTCTLAFHMPAPFDYPALSPVQIRSPGGINVSRVNSPVSAQPSANDVVNSTPVGSVPAIEPGHRYNIVSGPCEAGARLSYQIDSVGGLDMNWFQIVNPPLGPFIMVS